MISASARSISATATATDGLRPSARETASPSAIFSGAGSGGWGASGFGAPAAQRRNGRQRESDHHRAGAAPDARPAGRNPGSSNLIRPLYSRPRTDGERAQSGHFGAMGGSARHQGVVVDGGAAAPLAVTGSIGSPRRGVSTETPRLAASSTSVSAGSDQAW